jgi:hypothetical protein
MLEIKAFGQGYMHEGKRGKMGEIFYDIVGKNI